MDRTIFTGELSRLFYRTCQGISSALLPRRCVVCHSGIQAGSDCELGMYACQHCLGLVILAQRVRCQRCGLALGPRLQHFGWTHCRHCRPVVAEELAPGRECVVCCDYTPPFDQWITQLKYGKAHGLARFMGHWLALNAKGAACTLPDLLIPVPSSKEKLKQRGYNQAALIAQQAARVLGRPVNTALLLKTSEAATQAELGRAERLKNLQSVFMASRAIPKGMKIGLVDDVITTGATLESCETALRKAGAESIVIMAVCRTPE